MRISSIGLLLFLETEGGQYFFNLVKEGDQVSFATDDDNDRAMWVQAITRATGQTYKPTPPAPEPARAPVSNTQISRMKVGACPSTIPSLNSCCKYLSISV